MQLENLNRRIRTVYVYYDASSLLIKADGGQCFDVLLIRSGDYQVRAREANYPNDVRK
jgi:hypothetical protein